MADKEAKTKKPSKTEKEVKTEKPTQKKKEKRIVPEVNVYVRASFNNTIVTITDLEGKVLASTSPGAIGFSGTKKSTAFAATKAGEDAVFKVQKYGVREGKVYIKEQNKDVKIACPSFSPVLSLFTFSNLVFL